MRNLVSATNFVKSENIKDTQWKGVLFLLAIFFCVSVNGQIIKQYTGAVPNGIQDPGYSDLPRFLVDINNDGHLDYGRFVGSYSKPRIAFALQKEDGSYVEYGYWGPDNLDIGYTKRNGKDKLDELGIDLPWLEDVNNDSYLDYCRFAGPFSKNAIKFACIGSPEGFTDQQYVRLKTEIGERNIAKSKFTKQSSNYGDSGKAHLAVDGNTSGMWSDGSVTHTDSEDTNPWWEVDLGDVYDIHTIVIYNRTDCAHCSPALNNTYVMISESPIQFNNSIGAYGYISTAKNVNEIIGNVRKNIRGRYVRVFKKNNSILSLAEVEVYGSKPTRPLPNIAEGKKAEQSSITIPENLYYGGASRAVDGSINGDLPNTGEFFGYGTTLTADTDKNPWWEVDLGDIYNIQSIRVYNRTGTNCNDECRARLNNAYIEVANIDAPSSYKAYDRIGTAYRINHFDKKAVGRYIRISKKNSPILSLVEVVVRGSKVTPPLTYNKHKTVEVNYISGKGYNFRQISASTWECRFSQSRPFKITELYRDEWSVYLTWPDRGIDYQIDLHRKVLTEATIEHPITHHSNDRNAYMISLVEFANRNNNQKIGEFSRISTDYWKEIQTDGKIFTFKEEKKSSENIYLYDESRNVNIRLDIANKKVHYKEGKQAEWVLYDIINDYAITDPSEVGVLNFPGSSQSITVEGLSHSLKEDGLSLIETEELGENQCTIVYPRIDKNDLSAEFGVLVCNKRINGELSVTYQAIHSKSDVSNYGIGGKVEAGVGKAELTFLNDDGTKKTYNVTGPTANACGSISADRLCASAGGTVAGVQFTDEKGNGMGLSLDAGIGGGLAGNYDDGVLTVGLDLKIAIGGSLSLSVNLAELAENPEAGFWKVAETGYLLSGGLVRVAAEPIKSVLSEILPEEVAVIPNTAITIVTDCPWDVFKWVFTQEDIDCLD